MKILVLIDNFHYQFPLILSLQTKEGTSQLSVCCMRKNSQLDNLFTEKGWSEIFSATFFDTGNYAFHSSEKNPVILMTDRETHTGKLYAQVIFVLDIIVRKTKKIYVSRGENLKL